MAVRTMGMPILAPLTLPTHVLYRRMGLGSGMASLRHYISRSMSKLRQLQWLKSPTISKVLRLKLGMSRMQRMEMRSGRWILLARPLVSHLCCSSPPTLHHFMESETLKNKFGTQARLDNVACFLNNTKADSGNRHGPALTIPSCGQGTVRRLF